MAPPWFKDIPNLQPENWATASEKERIEALQRLENRLADSQNRPRCVVIDFEGPPHKEGRFNTSAPDVIEFNQLLVKIEQNDPQKAVAVVAHEGRHAYQFDCIKQPSKHNEVSNDVIAAWDHNMKPENYVRPSDNIEEYVRYRNQPIEADAFAYQNSVLSEIYSRQAKPTSHPDTRSSDHSEPTKPEASHPLLSTPPKPEPDWRAKWASHTENTKIPDPPPPPPYDALTKSKGRSR